MLHVYLNEKDVPKGTDIIPSNDALFDLNVGRLNVDDTIRAIIKEIDNAEYIGNYKVETRFGIVADMTDLSTGCKAAINVYVFPDKMINCIECGDNALQVIFRLKNGNILCKYAPAYLNMTVQVNVMLHHNGKTRHCKTLNDTVDNWGDWR